jgi:GT2 family glycosyltransferase
MLPNHLTWSLVVATYKRDHILFRCLKLAASQTHPPLEVIVVDASPDWHVTRDRVTAAFASLYPNVRLMYVKAVIPSLTAQRNQGIALACSDVLFLIDDDSLMYPDCATEVMKVYEADRDQLIKGVSAVGVPLAPDANEFDSGQMVQPGVRAIHPKQSAMRRFLKTVFATRSTYFLPYDAEYPDCIIPDTVAHLNIGRITVMAGYAMTFRREILLKEKFSEVLQRYAAGEDQDLSYRVSRHGALVNANNARLCHLEISGGRLSLYTVTVLAALNPSILQQLYSSNIALTNRRWKVILWRRLFIGLFKDIFEKRWSVPRFRAVMFSLKQLPKIHAYSRAKLLEWYPKFQEKLINAN